MRSMFFILEGGVFHHALVSNIGKYEKYLTAQKELFCLLNSCIEKNCLEWTCLTKKSTRSKKDNNQRRHLSQRGCIVCWHHEQEIKPWGSIQLTVCFIQQMLYLCLFGWQSNSSWCLSYATAAFRSSISQPTAFGNNPTHHVSHTQQLS